jgi:hypothetical protein
LRVRRIAPVAGSSPIAKDPAAASISAVRSQTDLASGPVGGGTSGGNAS